MAFFPFRKAKDESAEPAETHLSELDAIRRRAKQRLVGASVLVLAAALGLTWVLDQQPRPVDMNIAIDIPDKNRVPALTLPETQPQAASAPLEPAQPAAPAAALPVKTVASGEALVTPTPQPESATSATVPRPPANAAPAQAAGAAPAVPASATARTASAPAPKPTPHPDAKPQPAPDTAHADAQRARALLEGSAATPPASAGTSQSAESRFIVQFGAFADPARAQEARLKVEQAGLKTYTHVAETKEGKRIRTRVGPFTQRAEAEKAAEKIRKLGLPAAVLTL
ncbi:MAG: hypothetical protein OHK0048_02060 [Rhodoferax sp.]